MRALLTLICFAFALVLAGCDSEAPQPNRGLQAAQDGFSAAEAIAYTDDPRAMQKIYQLGVPHTDRQGKSMIAFEEGRSFFPLWMYGQKHPTTNYLCHPDESAKKWNSIQPTDPTRISNLAVLKLGNFNSAQYWGPGDFSSDFLNEIERLDMQALFYWQPLDRHLTSYEWDPSAGSSNLLDFVARNANHPNILGWIPTEETGRYFSLTEKTPEQWILHFKDVRRQFKGLSDRPVILLDNLWVSGQTELTLATDPSGALDAWLYWHQDDEIVALDNYVKNLRSLKTFDAINGLTRGGDFVARSFATAKPHWAMLNVFEEYPDGTTMGEHQFPSPPQLRAMAFMSIVHGATGLAYFGSDDYALREAKMIGIRPDTPTAYLKAGTCAGAEWANMLSVSDAKAKESQALWQTTVEINRQIGELAHVILQPTSKHDYRVAYKGTPISKSPIRTLLKRYKDSHYLIAVNLDDVALKARFSFSQPIQEAADVLFENRAIRADGKKTLDDEFEPFAVHIYRIRNLSE